MAAVGDCSKYFLCSPLLGEIIQSESDTHIFFCMIGVFFSVSRWIGPIRKSYYVIPYGVVNSLFFNFEGDVEIITLEVQRPLKKYVFTKDYFLR